MKRSIKVLIAGAVILAAGLTVRIAGEIIGITRAHNAAVAYGVPLREEVAKQMAEGMYIALITGAVGYLLAFIGLCIVIGGFIAYRVGRKREQLEAGVLGTDTQGAD